jgi:predicted helicase
MSEYSIKQYLSEVEKIIHYGGTKKETAIRNAFYNLLNEYAKGKGLMVVPEVSIKTPAGKTVTPDGTLKDSLRQDWGYWESKDEADIIDEEIKKKFDKGYPKENILFEDSQTAVLFQNGIEIMRVKMQETTALDKLLTYFVNFERPEVTQFRKAIELFKQDIPNVTETLRGIIVAQEKSNPKFVKASAAFLKICHDSINPDITLDDVREMMIQHILTEDIFNTIFDEVQFHRENNIARELEKVIITFFTGNTKRVALSSVQHYYQTINAAAAGIADHHEKQKFLKVVYETFYKSYNPKAADRLGVVYTPNEIVRFMVESTDYLLNKYFGKSLEDRGVEILDPATGTGTFICDIIDFIRKDKLEYKYSEEIHANEVAILPYYISNLNIEYTYKQKTGIYKEFKSLCFVDTLENLGYAFHGKQIPLFESLTEENSERIKRQNKRKISVIIGNPPYNALQLNANDQNPNRKYPEIDKIIRNTFALLSSATNLTKLFDMYTRFYSWAMNRIDENGIISFVTNRSFIDSRIFDGFRKYILKEFDYAYIIDTKSDVRANPKISGTGHNVFGIQTGVAIMFLIRRKENSKEDCKIFYKGLTDDWTKDVKLNYFSEQKLKDIDFEKIAPDVNNNWINVSDNNFTEFIAIASKDAKAKKTEEAIFKLYTMGAVTARDEWVYDYDTIDLINKVKFFINIYNRTVKGYLAGGELHNIDKKIKWSRNLINYLKRAEVLNFSEENVIQSLRRPFVKTSLYYSRGLINDLGYFPKILSKANKLICVNVGSGIFATIASNVLVDFACLINSSGQTQCLPLYQYDEEGNQYDNITDWALNKFIEHYKIKAITKEDIFYYSYSVLNNPNYTNKFKINLKRDFPRLPFYKDFFKWSDFGKKLMDLHINYENVKPFHLIHVDSNKNEQPITKLKANKDTGTIIIDDKTSITGVPPEAWNYKLGNRSALEWVLDQYKESKPKDPTIAEKFNTYKFADYKEQVIDLLKRVCTVSVETMKIIEEMKLETE